MGVKEADRNKGWVNVAQCMTLRTYDAFVAWLCFGISLQVTVSIRMTLHFGFLNRQY